MHFLRLAACAAIALRCTIAQAQVFTVEQLDKSFTVRAAPTITVVRESANPQAARAVVIMVPGGSGHIGFRAGMPYDRNAEPRTTWGRIARALSEPGQTSGALHYVQFDSPWSLTTTADMSPRATRDHMVRIESVAQFYRERYKLPVWVIGHSNGGFSIAEFVKHLQDKKNEQLLAGIIFSAGRTSAQFPAQTSLPALFMGAERDNCQGTLPAANVAIYEKFKAANNAPTEHVFIKGGESDGGDPCHSGIHMYNGAEIEAAKAIDAFVLRHTPPK